MAQQQKVEEKSKEELKRRPSIFDFEKPKEMYRQAQVPWVNTVQVGYDILRNPKHNKGLAFTWSERREMNLHGLLPAVYQDLDLQAKQVLLNIDRMQDNLDRYMYFMNILDVNEKLFYRVLNDNLPKLMPIVYTPTVGLACQTFGYIFTRPRGMWITIRDQGRIYQMLKNWPYHDVRAICVTDGQRILGLGDLGAFGMGIPIGKLALYTGCGGIKPEQLLPIMLDVGTDREDLRQDEFYIGIRQSRDKSKKYDDLIDEFMKAITFRFGPSTLIQFEDFGNDNAFRLLEKYQNDYCTFNDDIQGTAAVALAGIISSLKIKDNKIKKLKDHVYIFLGAGSAGIGIANLIAYGIHKECNKTIEECRKQIWLVDSQGLVFKNRKSGGIKDIKIPYAHEWKGKELINLEEIIEAVKGTVLIGVSGQPNSFNEKSCKALLKNNNRPLIFPMSNPTSKSECSAKDAYTWTNNNCIFASGSPFPSLNINGQNIVPAQGNNAYIFPGLALGVIASRSTRVTNEMFYIAALTLSNLVTEKLLEQGTIYPPIEEIRQVSFEIAVAVAEEAYKLGLAREVLPKDIRVLIRGAQMDHSYHVQYSDPVYNNLEKEFQ